MMHHKEGNRQGQQHHQQQQQQHQSTDQRLGESKWWRSCWNGNQLDGDLLYRTIKAQQERRLAAGNNNNNNQQQPSAKQQQTASSRANVAQLYATPRLHNNSQPSQEMDNRFKTNRRDDERTVVIADEDPLSDPLYASILGTSQQLKGITSQVKAGNQQRPSTTATTTTTTTTKNSSRSRLFYGSEFFPAASAHPTVPIYDNLTASSTCNNEAHLSDSSIDSASLQLKSLVERCIEVQRATQNNCSLLSISQNRNAQDTEDDEHQDEEESSSREKLDALRQKQMKLLQLNGGNQSSSSSTTTTTAVAMKNSHSGSALSSSPSSSQSSSAAVDEVVAATATASGVADSQSDSKTGGQNSMDRSVESSKAQLVNENAASPQANCGESDTCAAANLATNKEAAAAADSERAAGPAQSDTPNESGNRGDTGRDGLMNSAGARLSCRSSSLLSVEQQADEKSAQQKAIKLDEKDNLVSSWPNEIVIDQKSMSEFEQSSSAIRVIDVDACNHTIAEKREESDISLKLVNPKGEQEEEEEKLPKQQHQQMEQHNDEEEKRKDSIIDEAAKRNDLVKFFNHYKGSSWRNKQLAYQIPHQDIKLLASSSSNEHTSLKEEAELSLDLQRSRSAASIKSQSEDEINFIRSQRKLASQFKASLYYLSPVRQTTATANQSWSAKKANKRGSIATISSDQDQPTADESSNKLHHQCFKCKLPIEFNTSCVRVDNLKVNFGETHKQGPAVDHKRVDAAAVGERDRQNGEKCQSSQADGKNNDAIIVEEKTKENTASVVVAQVGQDEDKLQPSSSCDEGMGTGSSSNSSGQSSAAGSHCDDRETPPHVGLDESTSSSSSSCQTRPTDRAASADDEMVDRLKLSSSEKPCDITNNNYKLSLDSLNNIDKSTKALKNRRRTRSSVLIGEDEDEKLALEVDNTSSNKKSKKNRALTWTASLSSSIGASFKQLSGTKSKSSPKIEQIRATKARVEQTDEADETNETILFHKECFCCSTCNELLVDLRALIYMNEPIDRQQGSDGISDIEYVNLPTTTTVDGECSGSVKEEKVENGDSLRDMRREKNISLYCHRHFVELFKPRCQQCDCLILDEECTEAEGKVWHIKHFCCTECKVPLGGQQYIIVDQSQQQQQQINGSNKLVGSGRHKADQLAGNKDGQQNAPYCLRCFDQIFGETCEACGKLITCNLGAINHEQRCWHASPSCFKCHQCQRSLLGKPFLPSPDSHIYCSIECSDSKFSVPSQMGHQKLSLAQYCDPRAPSHKQLNQQQIELNRHKPLIDYLLANAGSDETSHQLLRYLYSQFNVVLSHQQQQQQQQQHNKPLAGELDEQAKLVAQIGATLTRLENQQQQGGNSTSSAAAAISESALTARRNKLNPFLIDSFGVQESSSPFLQQNNRESQHENNNNNNNNSKTRNAMTIVMDGLEQKLAAAAASSCNQTMEQQQRQQMLLANYINLDFCQPTANQVASSAAADAVAVSSQKTQRDSVDNASSHLVNSSRQHSSMMALRLVGGKHLTTGGNGNNIKASQCSPAASLVSNEGTISDHSSATSSGVSSTAPTLAGGSHSGSLKSHSPLSSTSSHSSISSSNLLPTSIVAASSTALGATTTQGIKTAGHQMQMINSITASVERRRRVQPITELSVVDLLSVADDKMHQQQSEVAFDQLVSHFETSNNNRRGNLQLQRPISGHAKQQHQQPQHATGQNSKQQESFFQELAQRLPNNRKHSVDKAATPTAIMPLDTNGLPTVEREESSRSRIVTDHYSTVNKAHKLQQQRNNNGQQVANDDMAAAKMRESFFAITSPLLDCEAGRGGSIRSGGSPASGTLRPTSSLSVLMPDNVASLTNQQQVSQFDHQQQHLQASVSTSSLLLKSTSSCFGLPAAINQQRPQQQQPVRLQPKPAKSVTFDPAVKDPPSSCSSTMTLGRASALRSALKSSSTASGQAWIGGCNVAAQYNSQFLATTGSSATMPSSLANQIKANGAAYTALYDDQGRRIKLSSLINQQQQPCDMVQEAEEVVDSAQTSSKSILSRLGFSQSSSSRGGRREERKLRQQQAIVQTQQPMSLMQPEQLFVQPLDEMPQQPFMGAVLQPPVQQNTQQVLMQPSTSSTSLSKHRSDQQTRRYSRRTSRRRRSNDRRSRSRRSSKYCTDTDCYDEDADDSDGSSVSRCSTCSSTSYMSDSSVSSQDEDYSDDDHSSVTLSYTSCSSYSGSEYTTSDSETERYSSSCDSSSSRSPSPCSSTRSASREKRLKTSRPTSRRHHSSRGNRRHPRLSSSHQHRRRSETSNNSGRARSSSSRTNRSSRDQRHRRQRDRHHGRGSSSSKGRSRSSHSSNRSTTSSRSAGSRRSSNRSSSSSRRNQHSGQHRSSSSHHRMHREQQVRTNPPDSVQIQHQQQLIQMAPSSEATTKSMRSKSPSTLSTDSKSACNNSNAENCRLI